MSKRVFVVLDHRRSRCGTNELYEDVLPQGGAGKRDGE